MYIFPVSPNIVQAMPKALYSAAQIIVGKKKPCEVATVQVDIKCRIFDIRGFINSKHQQVASLANCAVSSSKRQTSPSCKSFPLPKGTKKRRRRTLLGSYHDREKKVMNIEKTGSSLLSLAFLVPIASTLDWSFVHPQLIHQIVYHLLKLLLILRTDLTPGSLQ